MGAFFTNVQVHTGSSGAEAARPKLIAAVRRTMAEAGLTEVGEGEEADRTVAIGPAGEAPWIAVYDEATEDQDTKKLDALAAALSAALGTAAAWILIHDSAVLELGLYRRGERADRYSSRPEYFSGKKPGKKARERWSGHEDRWQDLLAPGKSPEDLRRTLDDEKLFAESTLQALTPLVGWDPRQCSVGYRYLDRAGPAVVRLGFRLPARPRHESKAAGPTVFEGAGHMTVVDACVGDPLRISVAVMNTGGGSRGLSMAVWGPAIEQGLITPERVQLVIGVPQKGVRPEMPLESRPIEGGTMFVGKLPDLVIRPGLAAPGGLSGVEPGQHQRAMDAWFDTQIHAMVEGKVDKPGAAQLHIGFVPSENAGEGQFSHSMDLRIARPFRRPLKCAPGTESHVLRPLAQPTRLFAFISLGEDRAASAAFAAEAIERWVEHIAPKDVASFSTSLMPADPGARPKTGTLKAKGFKASRRWKEIRAELSTLRAFSATRSPVEDPSAEDEDGPPPSDGGAHGFSLTSPLYPMGGKADPPLPHLGLWLDLDGKSDADVAAARALLREIAEQAMERAGAAQAIVGRWGWAPEFIGDMTPYESASGVDGQCTMQRSWCQRFLRGVTEDTLWLGPALVERLGSTEGLTAAASVTKVGGGLRVELRAPGDIDAVERALEKLLPDREDWRAGVNRLYERG